METTEYAVVVVDLMMPIVDGFAVVDYVRTLPGRRPAVIVISAADAAMVRKLNGTVVHSVLRKPFDIDVLGDLIAAAARTMREEQEKIEDKVVTFRLSR